MTNLEKNEINLTVYDNIEIKNKEIETLDEDFNKYLLEEYGMNSKFLKKHTVEIMKFGDYINFINYKNKIDNFEVNSFRDYNYKNISKRNLEDYILNLDEFKVQNEKNSIFIPIDGDIYDNLLFLIDGNVQAVVNYSVVENKMNVLRVQGISSISKKDKPKLFFNWRNYLFEYTEQLCLNNKIDQIYSFSSYTRCFFDPSLNFDKLRKNYDLLLESRGYEKLNYDLFLLEIDGFNENFLTKFKTFKYSITRKPFLYYYKF
jgi:hypothetical protein